MKREIGATGLKVNPIGLGGMPLSIEGRPEESQAFAVIEAFVEAGGDFIDTANAYCLDDRDMGHNERLVHKYLTRLRALDRVIVATKGGLKRPQGEWKVDGRPQWIRASCEKSLRDLNTDCITLYQLHAVDPHVPFADTLGELVRLQQQGKIRHIGLSNVRADQLEAALSEAQIVSVQNRCNCLEKRDFRTGLVRLCGDRGIAYIPHSPVGGHHGHVRLAKTALVRQLAAKYNTSVHGIALAWLLARGGHILPIPGASKVASVTDSLRAVSTSLTAEDVAAIDHLPDA